MRVRFPFLLFLFLLILSCSYPPEGTTSDTKQKELIVFAAASLGNVLEEIKQSFEQKNTIQVRMNLASSGTLARQISQGAPAGIFISANITWLEYLNRLQAWDTLAYNRLVLIAPQDYPVPEIDDITSQSLLNILQEGRLSLGDPAHAPAGIYAQEALEYSKSFAPLQDKLLPAKDVRSALMLVELGEAPLGIVYRTDAQASKQVKIVYTFPSNTHQAIAYGAGLVQDSPLNRQFLAYLSSPEAQAIWRSHGFRIK